MPDDKEVAAELKADEATNLLLSENYEYQVYAAGEVGIRLIKHDGKTKVVGWYYGYNLTAALNAAARAVKERTPNA